eukprot:gene16600-biopygen11474
MRGAGRARAAPEGTCTTALGAGTRPSPLPLVRLRRQADAAIRPKAQTWVVKEPLTLTCVAPMVNGAVVNGAVVNDAAVNGAAVNGAMVWTGKTGRGRPLAIVVLRAGIRSTALVGVFGAACVDWWGCVER